MPTLEIQVPADHLAFNRQRWQEILQNQELARFEGKVESNRHGQILMMPPASGEHSRKQSGILITLNQLLGGNALVECPISTLDGVRAADVGWYSEERFARVTGQVAFEIAPEICVEVVSPSNTIGEMEEKRNLYFQAGAEECWICSLEGQMVFFYRDSQNEMHHQSRVCPEFPHIVK